MQNTIFTVTGDDLARLNPNKAIQFIADLLWLEAGRTRLPVGSVSVSSRVNVADGGVDAKVVGAGSGTSSLIHQGTTAFQVKTGEFAPWQPAVVRDELFGKNPVSKTSLGRAVRDCMDDGGCYVLVCAGQDLTPLERDDAIKHLRKCFEDCDYINPRVDVLGQSQLIGCLMPFPSLCLAMNGRGGSRFQTWTSWSMTDQMQTVFVAGEAQALAIGTLRQGLQGATAAVHIRVRGEAGVGKTRLVLEAVSAVDLAPFVTYCSSPQDLQGGLLNELLRDDNTFEALLVVDECNSDQAVRLWNQLKHRGPRIRLLTIYNEHDNLTIPYVDAPPLQKSEIAKILQEYIPATERADRWAEFCDGSPRVAHVIGGNLKNHPDDLLRLPDTVNVWGRYVAGNDDFASTGVQQRHRVLRYLALFKRFGYGGALVEEARSVARKLQASDGSITWERFQEIVQELKARKILQGENTLYITPRLFHIKLWTEWWDTHGNGFNIEDFSKDLSSELIGWFYEMFQYAAESKTASAFVQALLGPEGPFKDGEFLKTDQGSRFCLALTDASPESALKCLRATVGTWNAEQLLLFKTGRRNVIWALQRIAVWRNLFPDAARVMLQLAEAENETWANNATGVFASFFSPGQGALAPTEATPAERFPILREALTSPFKARRAVGLAACDQALETLHFSRIVGAEHQGLRRAPLLWQPETWPEVFDAYRRVWSLLTEQLEGMEADEQVKAVDILVQNARGLYYMEPLSAMVIETVNDLISKPYVDRKKLIELVESVLHYDGKGFTAEQRAPWEFLQASLIGSDFHSRMQRFVGMELVEDQFDENNELVDKVGPTIGELASEAVQTPDCLWPELPWLMGDGAKNGYRFGFDLGTRDPSLDLLHRLVDEQRSRASVFFLAGYLRALFEREPDAWEAQMDLMAADPVLRTHVPELTWRGGMTDRAARRVLTLAQGGLIEPMVFRIFAFGGVIRSLSPGIFNEWIEFLLGVKDRASAHAALDLYHFYYAWKDSPAPLPDDLTFRLLTHPPLFGSNDSGFRGSNDDYDWTEIARTFTQQYPGRVVDLASVMLEHFGEDNTIIGRFHSPTLAILSLALRAHPVALWKKVAGYLGPPIDSRAFSLRQWLRDGDLALIPAEAIFDWVDEDPDKRAWYAASFVPKTFPGAPSSFSARQLLVRYGAREDVRRNLTANFWTELWTGQESRHLENNIRSLRDASKEETDANVLRWLDEYAAATEHRLERARMEEEREGF